MRSLPNRHSPCGTGAESGRRRASMNPATILPGMGRQPHCDAPRIAAHASAGLKSEAADVHPVDPSSFSSVPRNSGIPGNEGCRQRSDKRLRAVTRGQGPRSAQKFDARCDA